MFELRPFKNGDEALIISMYGEPHVADMLTPPNPDRIAPSLAAGDGELQLIWSGQEAVGLILITVELPWLCCIRQLVAKRQRQGIGVFGMLWALQRIFDQHRSHRAYLEVKARNSGARALYERFGFVHEGTWRDGMKNPLTGDFEDLCAYGLLDHEYRALMRTARDADAR